MYERSYIEGLEQMRFLENGIKMRVVDVDYRGRETTSGLIPRKMLNGLRKYLRNMESSIFRDLDGIVDSILFPYHTLEEVLPPGCEAGPVWMEFACWVDSQKVDIRASESPLFLNICGIPASGKSYWAVKWLSENGPCLHIAFDAIMEALSGYQADYSLDREKASYVGNFLLVF